jgi:hypothetical protein
MENLFHSTSFNFTHFIPLYSISLYYINQALFNMKYRTRYCIVHNHYYLPLDFDVPLDLMAHPQYRIFSHLPPHFTYLRCSLFMLYFWKLTLTKKKNKSYKKKSTHLHIVPLWFHDQVYWQSNQIYLVVYMFFNLIKIVNYLHTYRSLLFHFTR